MPKILLVDDDDAVRRSIEDHFEDDGYIVQSAKTGEDGLKIIADDQFDAVIVDLRLPGISGETFIKKAHPLAPKTAFLLYTGSMQYSLSPDLSILKGVSHNVFQKPILDLFSLNAEIERLMNDQ